MQRISLSGINFRRLLIHVRREMFIYCAVVVIILIMMVVESTDDGTPSGSA